MKGISVFLVLLCIPFSAVKAQTYMEYIDSSFIYLDNGNLAAAEQALLKALRSEPGNPENVMLLSNLGTIQRRMGKKREALQSYDNALVMAPQSIRLLENRAALLAEMDSLQRARDDYSLILLIDDKSENALYRRGLVELEQGDTAAARRDFEQLLAINPQSTEACMGMAALMKYRGYYTDAINLYTLLLRSMPQEATFYLNRAEAYYYTRQYNRADADVAQAIALAPDDPLPYVLRGRLKLVRYAKEEAQQDFDKAVELGFDARIIEEILATNK